METWGGPDTKVVKTVDWGRWITGTLISAGLVFTIISCSSIRVTGAGWLLAALTEFQVQASDEEIVLLWTNHNGFIATLIRYSTKDFPENPWDGYPVPNGNDGRFTPSPERKASFVHSGLSNGTTYYYAAFACDEVPNYSEAVTGSGTPRDETAPAAPVFFSAHGGEGLVTLRWVQAADKDVAGTLIRYSTERFPINPTDELAVFNGSKGLFPGSTTGAGSFLHKDLTNGTMHYYAAFAYDEIPNFSTVVIDSALPEDTTPPTLTIDFLQDHSITSNLDVILLASEELDSGSVKVLACGSPLTMNLIDSERNLWQGSLTLTASGTFFLTASADDLAGNAAGANSSFAAKLLFAERGGSVASPDGILEIQFGPGALGENTFVLVRSSEQSSPFGKTLPNRRDRLSYTVSPPGSLRGEEAVIAIRYSSLDLSGASPDRLSIRDDELGVPLRLNFDAERKIASAGVSHLGGISLAIGDESWSIPEDPASVVLQQNQPNPFNPTTTIRFVLHSSQEARLDVFGISGKRVRTLVNRHLTGGEHAVVWDGTNERGIALPSGVYIYQLRASEQTVARKMILLR